MRRTTLFLMLCSATLSLSLTPSARAEAQSKTAAPLAIGDLFPRLEAEFLTGRKAVLPDAAAGKVALVMMGFTYDSRFAVEKWAEHVNREFGTNDKVTFFEVPVIGGMGRMAKWFIDSGMRKGTPKELHENVITVYGGADRWKKTMGFSKDRRRRRLPRAPRPRRARAVGAPRRNHRRRDGGPQSGDCGQRGRRRRPLAGPRAAGLPRRLKPPGLKLNLSYTRMRIHTRLHYVLAVLAAAGLAAGQAAAQSPLTLDEAIARALKQNPATRGADAAQREASERARQAKAGWMPRLDADGNLAAGEPARLRVRVHPGPAQRSPRPTSPSTR